MNKKVSMVVTSLVLLLSANSYAQKNELARKSLKALTGGVPSAFSTETALSVRSVNILAGTIASAQFMLKSPTYVSSAELFNRVHASQVLSEVQPSELRLLGDKFSQLDAVAVTQPRGSYTAALWSMSPATDPVVLNNPHVHGMMDVLNIQQYMKLNDNQFPRIYTVMQGGWLTATTCLDSIEGNQAFLGVVSILVKEQTGEVSQAVVDQLATLYASASNRINVQDIVDELKKWRAANRSTDAPKLPTSMEGISLRNNPETLWLTTEIRLLQLTADENLPEIIKTAQVTK